MTYIYAWGPRFRISGLPVLDRKGKPCKLIARGRKNSALVVFDDGMEYIVSQNALRKPKADNGTYWLFK